MRWIAPAVLPVALSIVATLPAALAQTAAKPKSVPADTAHQFEMAIRPVFAESCTGCHGKEAQEGGLRLDQAITVQQAERVLARIRGEGGKQRMPPGQAALAPEKIKSIEAWTKSGAPWPSSSGSGRGGLWSLKPVRLPAIPKPKSPKLAAWANNPVDAFVASRLESAGLAPAPVADRRTLIRRLSYDLTGLAPAPDEIDRFIADTKPGAYERLVDRILESPRYGERQARMWMDIARYADTKGYVFVDDRNYYNAYTYRNWLIDSFNNDLPYDQFVIQQLAADKLSLGEDRKPLAAMGFLTIGRRFLNAENDIIGDRIDVTTRGFLGLTVQCARCHDHKFDPISTLDYYGMYSVFASSEEHSPSISPKAITEPWEAHNAKVAAATGEREKLIRQETEALRARLKEKPDSVDRRTFEAVQLTAVGNLPSDDRLRLIRKLFDRPADERIVALDAELASLRSAAPPSPEFAMGMRDKAQLVTVNIHKRGNPNNPGDPAPRRFLSCIAGEKSTEWTADSGRLDLAKSIANPDNPLTSRVFVNRVWLGHFGYGLVRTPSDFGIKGELPTHPELLDWLAYTFSRTDNWSIKKLHRRIVLSNTYKQSSNGSAAADLKDAENRLLSHQNRRRLDMEQMRDSLLHAAGALDVSKVGGKSEELWAGKPSTRRAVYGFIERQNLPLTFKTFDFASPDASSPMRFQTTVPQQALFLLNSPLAIDQAKSLAKRPEVANAANAEGTVRSVYRILFGRSPSADEAALGIQYLSAEPRGSQPATSEFSYGFGSVDESGKTNFEPLPKFASGSWRGGDDIPDIQLGWVHATASGGHPGAPGKAVIRRWTSPFDGSIRIEGTLSHPGKEGDGVRAQVVVAGAGIVGTWTAKSGKATIHTDPFRVKKGTTVDFVVDCRSEESHDSFDWIPRIVPTSPARMAVRDASALFGGPGTLGPSGLSRLERYAHALMISNEFFFID